MSEIKTVLLGSIGVSFETWLPYASGCLQAHAMKDPKVNSRYQFLSPIFRYQDGENLDEILLQTNILGLTCYVWNQTTNNLIAKRFKSLKKDGVVLYGGPNIPQNIFAQEQMARELPFVDYFFSGPGEENFSNFLVKYSEGTKSHFKGSFGLLNNEFYTQCSDKVSQLNNENLPDPYSTGVFKQIFNQEKRLKCSFETNRGCPYNCSFCDWGGTSNSRISQFDIDAVKKTLDHIYAQKNIVELEILDANFGMFKRDLEIVEYMVSLKKKHGHSPKISYSGLAKNGSKYLAPILEKIHLELGAEKRNLKISFQSHTKEALKNANRENIKNEKLFSVVADIEKWNLPVTSEMIIGLPGETPQSWLSSLQKNYDLGIHYIRTYFLIVARNTDFDSKETQQRLRIKTKKLCFPRKFSGLGYKHLVNSLKITPDDWQQFEEYEIIRECYSYNLEDLKAMFDYWWFYHNFVNSGSLKQTVASLSERGASLTEQIQHFFHWLPNSIFLSELVQKNRSLIENIFRDEDISRLSNLSEYFYFSRCLRQDDIYQMQKNKLIFFNEMDDYLSHWIPDTNERNLILKDQKQAWIDDVDCDNWSDSKKFFGTDASLLKQETLNL